MPLSDIGWINPESVLDIGANVGTFSREAMALWPRAKFFLIEGNPACRQALSETGFPFAISVLSDSEKEAVFYQRKCGGPSTGDSLYRELTQWYDDDNVLQTMVITQRLDDIVIGDYDFIKLDVQGAELDVLRGGMRTLGSAKWVLMEVAVEKYNDGAPLWDDVVKFMDEKGFDLSTEIGDIIHPIGRHLIQKDVLFIRRNENA